MGGRGGKLFSWGRAYSFHGKRIVLLSIQPPTLFFIMTMVIKGVKGVGATVLLVGVRALGGGSRRDGCWGEECLGWGFVRC